MCYTLQAMDKVTGYVEKIIYRNPANGYTVLSVEEEDGHVTCTGNCMTLSEGEFVELEGEFVFHATYGLQLKIRRAKSSLPPDNIMAVERYLASGAIKGIGEVTAKRIVERFGADTLRIMDEEPERLSEIKGISKRKAQEIGLCQEEKKELRNALIFLGEYGISNALAVKLYNEYQGEIYSIIRTNPYRLADDISGIGFKKADEIAFKGGIEPGSEFRIKSCLIYILQVAASEGNVYLPDEILKKRVQETLAVSDSDDVYDISFEEIDRCTMDLAIDCRIIIKEDENEQRQIFYSSYYYTELYIAKLLHNIDIPERIRSERVNERIDEVSKALCVELDGLQRQAVFICAQRGVTVITGGPGTGKTTTINAIIRFFEQEGKNILLAAPTGRAAKRMTEATGFGARTIHRMLELSGEISDSSPGANFERNEDNPLDADVVIVDEMSMVDIFLMNALLKAIRPGTKLILVGDADQLPSVGAGNVLKDIIASGCIRTVKLTRIFRQDEGSDIVLNAHKINKGQEIELKSSSRDFIFIKRDDPDVILASVLTLIKDKLPGYVGCSPEDIQVLSPSKRGALGTERLNRFLQSRLNPKKPGKNELPVRDMIFREGDKVMHIKNNYELEWEMRTETGFVYEKGKGIFNGDLGVITIINEHTQMMEVLFDDGKYVIYSYEGLDEVTLAYAATVHKSQGSEYPAVILPLLSGPQMLMNRNILYTAVTRAKKCVCIVGSEETVQNMIKNEREERRYSGLKDRLLEMEGTLL